jgi:hypothetical protein
MALPTILRVTSLDKPLKEFIIPKIINDSTGTLQVDKFNIGYGTLDFTDVTLNTKNGQLSVHIDAIALSISFWNFIINPTSKQHYVGAVYLINPTVIVRKDNTAGAENSSDSADYRFIRDKIKPLQKVPKIIVKNGMIEWQDKKNRIAVAQHLSGSLTLVDSANLKIDVTGDILSYTDNQLQLIVDVDLQNEELNADVIIDNYDLKKSIFSVQKSYIDGLKSGVIDGRINIKNRGLTIRNAQINGYFNIKNFSLLSDKIDIKDMNISTIVKNNSLEIKDAKGLLFSAPLTFSGNVDNIFKPAVKGRMKIDELNVRKLNKLTGRKNLLWSKISLQTD